MDKTHNSYGLFRGMPPQPAVLREIVTPPSGEWVEQFGVNFTEKAPDGTITASKIGKFVASGEFVLFSPFPNYIAHEDITKARPDLKTEIAQGLEAAEADGLLLPRRPGVFTDVTDAGFFFIDNNDDGSVREIFLRDESTMFGRADDAGRARTADFLRVSLNGITINSN